MIFLVWLLFSVLFLLHSCYLVFKCVYHLGLNLYNVMVLLWQWVARVFGRQMHLCRSWRLHALWQGPLEGWRNNQGGVAFPFPPSFYAFIRLTIFVPSCICKFMWLIYIYVIYLLADGSKWWAQMFKEMWGSSHGRQDNFWGETAIAFIWHFHWYCTHSFLYWTNCWFFFCNPWFLLLLINIQTNQ